MTKHILPLTHEPKIPDVRNEKCTQTIRPKSDVKPKNVGDFVMFHGWSGKPYRSRWSWRTSYMKIIEAFDLYFQRTIPMNDVFRPEDMDFYDWLDIPRLSVEKANEIAILDGFKDADEMFEIFYEMYGDKLFNQVFRVIRWEPYKNHI